MEIKLNTKLRLENSALGTYEITAVGDSMSQAQLPKGLKLENFLGTVISTDSTQYLTVIGAMVSRTEGKVIRYNLLLAGNLLVAEYYPETGVFQLSAV